MANNKGPNSSSSNAACYTSTTSTTKRLAQVSNHVAPEVKTDKKAHRKAKEQGPPDDYSDIMGHLAFLRNRASTPDTSRRGYIRQKSSGKLWVRERVDQLFDPGTFVEVGSASGSVEWKKTGPKTEEPLDFVPSNNVQGFGKLLGRRVVFTADDYSLRAGHADGALISKSIYMEKLSIELRLPIVKLTDGSSGGGSVSTIQTQGFAYVPPMYEIYAPVARQLNLGIPNLGAVLGPAIGLGAARVVSCHFSVMSADIGSLFNAGPAVVAEATGEEGLSFTELGGPSVHCANGTIDNLASNEAECFKQLRTVLSFLPNSGTDIPPIITSDDCPERLAPELRSLVPRRRERMYNPRKIITTVVDQDSWFEIGALWGLTAIVGLARLAGRPVGIVASNCEVNAGAIDALGAQKVTRHLKFLDVFNLPLVQFVDVPGYAIGTVAEKTAVMRHGVNLGLAYFNTTIPLFNVIIRKVYGVAGGLMVDCRDPRLRVAWPSGEWGSLPLEGGVEVGHRHELNEVERVSGPEARAKRYKEIFQEYQRLMNPVRTANAFGVEEIIDPAATRPLLCLWIQHVYDSILPIRVADRKSGKINPSFP